MDHLDTTSCFGYLAYLFQNQEVNSHIGNLITICPINGWRSKGASSAPIVALFGKDVSRSQHRAITHRYSSQAYLPVSDALRTTNGLQPATGQEFLYS